MLRDWWKQEVSSRWRKSRRLSTSQATQDLQVEVVQRKGWAAHDTPEVSISKECLSIAIIDSEYFQMLYISQNLTCHVHPSCIVHASTCLFWNNLAFDLCSHMESTLRPQKKIVCVKEIVSVWLVCCVWDVCDADRWGAGTSFKREEAKEYGGFTSISTHIHHATVHTLGTIQQRRQVRTSNPRISKGSVKGQTFQPWCCKL